MPHLKPDELYTTTNELHNQSNFYSVAIEQKKVNSAHPNKHITSFLTHPFISQTKKSLCRVDCCINLSQYYLSLLGRKIVVGIPGGRVGMRSVGIISESRSCGGCGAIPAVYHQQQRGKVPEGLGHHNGSTTSTKTEQWCHPRETNGQDLVGDSTRQRALAEASARRVG